MKKGLKRRTELPNGVVVDEVCDGEDWTSTVRQNGQFMFEIQASEALTMMSSEDRWAVFERLIATTKQPSC